MPTFLEALTNLLDAGAPVVTVTIVDAQGSVPQDRGAKMIVTADGLHFGTVGGGKVETKAIAEAQRMLRREEREQTKFVSWNLNKDVGMTCGGIVKLYFEAYNVARWNIVVFGAGHIAQALVSLLVHLDCQVTCIDPRPEWLAKLPQSPNLTAVHAADMPSLVKTLPDDAYVILMTMGHSTDKPILLEILRTRTFPYLGAIGSHSKAVILRRDVAEAGLPAAMQHAFHCPIGLEIGSNHPFEIAVSVVAQLIQIRDENRQKNDPSRAEPRVP
jgi:xanthine dehydrogenase accessory factor